MHGPDSKMQVMASLNVAAQQSNQTRALHTWQQVPGAHVCRSGGRTARAAAGCLGGVGRQVQAAGAGAQAPAQAPILDREGGSTGGGGLVLVGRERRHGPQTVPCMADLGPGGCGSK